MTWPQSGSRLTTYAPGVEVKSADLNAMQDAIVREREIFVGPGAAMTDMTFNPYYLSGSGEAEFHLPLATSDRVKAIKLFLRDTSGTALSVRMVDVDMSAVPYAISEARTPVTSDASGDDQELDLAEDLPFVVPAKMILVVQCFNGGASKRLYGVRITYDRNA